MPLCGLRIERRVTPSAATLVLSGELDLAAVGTADAVLAAELAAAQGDVDVDLSGLGFLSVGAVDVLIASSRRMAVDHRRLRVTATNRIVDRALELAGVELSPTAGGEVFVPSRRTSRDAAPCRHATPDTTRHPPPGSSNDWRPDLMPNDFTIGVQSRSGTVELVVTGELDVLTAAPLREALRDASVRSATVAVNLAAVTFIDSTALHTLVNADRSLRTTGGRLHLIDPSTVVVRLLELSGMGDHFEVDRRPPPMTLEDRLGEIMTDLAGIVVTASSLRDDLEQVIAFSCNVLPGCDAASVALLIDGTPTTVAVSEHIALELDIVQYDNDEGPCLSALSGERIRVDIVAADERFPHFAIGAADQRVNSILSMPIIHDGDIVGTLNFYAHEPGAFDDTADHIARLASGQAAAAIVRSDVLIAAQRRRDQLQAHYDEAALVARAQGVLIATHHCSNEQARNLINHAATTEGDTLLTIAHRILDTARNNPNG